MKKKAEQEKFQLYRRPRDRAQTTLSDKNKKLSMIFKNFLSPESNCIDIGANIGMVTILMSQLCHNGKILSIEPDETNFSLLKHNLEINKITNVVTKKYGVSDKNGKYFLYGNKRNGGDTRLSKLPQKNGKKPSEEVEVFTLDHIVKDWDVNFDIVKIDTQGMDFQCMLGASDFLQNNPNCSFVIEFVKSMPNMEPLHKPYRPYDFCAFLFDKFDSIYNIDQSMYMSYKQLKKFAKQGTGEIDLWCRNDK